MVRDSNAVKYQQYVKPPVKVGDIAYWDGSSVKTVPLSGWKDNLGTPVGVVMIPNNFLPDTKARIISLNDLGRLQWDTSSDHDTTDSPVPNFTKVPTTDNAGSTSTGSNIGGGTYLPSDRTDSDWLSTTQSYVDPLAKYHEYATLFNPSPYLEDAPNPAYSVVLDGGNALSDFNGLTNTQLLVNEGEQYHAAHACWNYKDAANSNLQWYLPAMGELGFLMPRFELINTSIQAVGGAPVEKNTLWSSSEHFNNVIKQSYYPYHLEIRYGIIDSTFDKRQNLCVRTVSLL